MNRGRAQAAVTGSALITGGIYLYRRLVEPSATTPTSGTAGQGPIPQTEFAAISREKTALQPKGVGSIPTQVFFGAGPVASTPRFVVGWGFTYVVLSLWASASGGAGWFALLIAAGAVLGNGQKVSADIQAQLDNRAGAAPTGTAAPAAAAPTVPVAWTMGGIGAAPRQPRGPRPNTHTAPPPNTKPHSLPRGTV